MKVWRPGNALPEPKSQSELVQMVIQTVFLGLPSLCNPLGQRPPPSSLVQHGDWLTAGVQYLTATLHSALAAGAEIRH